MHPHTLLRLKNTHRHLFQERGFAKSASISDLFFRRPLGLHAGADSSYCSFDKERGSPPVLCLVDSTFQHLLLNEDTFLYQSCGVMRPLLSGYALAPRCYTSKGASHPSILEALTIAAAQLVNDSAKIPNVPMMSEGDNKAASKGFGHFLRKHQKQKSERWPHPQRSSFFRPSRQTTNGLASTGQTLNFANSKLLIHIRTCSTKTLFCTQQVGLLPARSGKKLSASWWPLHYRP